MRSLASTLARHPFRKRYKVEALVALARENVPQHEIDRVTSRIRCRVAPDTHASDGQRRVGLHSMAPCLQSPCHVLLRRVALHPGSGGANDGSQDFVWEEETQLTPNLFVFPPVPQGTMRGAKLWPFICPGELASQRPMGIAFVGATFSDFGPSSKVGS